MTTYKPVYRLRLRAPRSVDPTERTILTPVAGAPHAQPFRVATKACGSAARIGATTSRYLIRNPVGTWPTTALTVEAWVRHDLGVGGSGAFQGIASYAFGSQMEGILLGIREVSGAWKLELWIQGTQRTTAITFPNDALWHHVLATWTNATNTYQVFLDGVLGETGILGGAALTGAGAFVLGHDQDSVGGGFEAAQAWAGELDEVRVYSRVLSATEAAEHWAETFKDETGLCLHASFDVPTALGRDHSPAGNHLTVVGIDSATDDTILHYFPYLEDNPVGRRGRLDVASRRLDTGEMTLRLLDKKMGTTNLSRWATAFIGDAKGRLRAAGLLAEVDESLDGTGTWGRFFTGRVISPALEGRLWYRLAIRESTDELQVSLFSGRISKSLGEPAPGACTAALAGAGAGNVDNGTHSYKVTCVTIMGESAPGPASNNVTVTDKTVNGQVNLTGIPLGSTDCVARRIYRNELFLTEITNNTTTTYTDNIAASSLGRNIPTVNRSEYVFRQSLVPKGLMKPFGSIRPAPSLKATVKTVGGVSGKQISFQLDNNQLSRPDVIMTPYFVDLLRRLANGLDPNNSAAADYPDWLRVHAINQQANTVATGGYGAEGDFKTAALLTPQRLPLGDSDLSMVFQLVVADEIHGLDPEYVPVTKFAENDAVTLDFYSIEPPTQQNPLYIGDVHAAQLKRDILDGYHGQLWEPGETPPPGKAVGDPKRAFPYDAAAFATLIADATIPKFRGIIYRREKKAIDWLESAVDLAFNFGSRVDEYGRLVPLDLRFPAAVPSVPTLTEADLLTPEAPTWEPDSSQAVGIVTAKHYVDRELAPTEYASYRDPPPGMILSTDILTVVADFSDLDATLRDLELDLVGYRSQPNESLNGFSRLEAIRRQLSSLVEQLRIPFARGPVTISLPVRRNASTAAQIGDWRLLQIDSLPDPATFLRGGLRLARVIERSDDRSGRRLQLLDSGLALVATAPTLGTVVTETGNTKHGIQVPVTLNASGEPVVVEIAQLAGGSPPAATSPLWMVAGRVTTTSTLTIRNLGAGKRFWVRARTVPSGGVAPKLPSAYVAASAHIDTAALTAPSSPATSGLTNAEVTCTWTNGEANELVNFYLASPNTGTPVLLLRLPAGTTRHRLTGLNASTSYRFEVSHVDAFESETTHVGADFTTAGTIATPATPRIVIAEGALS